MGRTVCYVVAPGEGQHGPPDTEPPESVGGVLWLGINSPEGKIKQKWRCKPFSWLLSASSPKRGEGDVGQPCCGCWSAVWPVAWYSPPLEGVGECAIGNASGKSVFCFPCSGERVFLKSTGGRDVSGARGVVCPVCLPLVTLCSQLMHGEKTLGVGRAEIFG